MSSDHIQASGIKRQRSLVLNRPASRLSHYSWHEELGQVMNAEEAFALSQRFEFYYTPKSASWLNLIEIEFSALSKQCLNRRIATQEELTREVLAIVKEREEKGIKIDWQFSIKSARSKLNRHYQQVNSDNAKYQLT